MNLRGWDYTGRNIAPELHHQFRMMCQLLAYDSFVNHQTWGNPLQEQLAKQMGASSAGAIRTIKKMFVNFGFLDTKVINSRTELYGQPFLTKRGEVLLNVVTIAVTFKNRKERLKFLKMCEEEGLSWLSGDPATRFDPGDGAVILFGSCGRDNLTYRDAAQKDCKTIPFSEFDRPETIGVIKRKGKTITVYMGDLHGTAKCSPDDQFDLYTGCELALRRALGVQKDKPVYTTIFKPDKRYKVSVRAYKQHRKNVPIWMTENDGKTVEVTSPNMATCGVYTYTPNCCEEIQEPEKPVDPEKPKYYNGKMVCVDNGEYSWWTVGKIYEYKDGIVTSDDGGKYPKNGQEPYRDAEDAKHPGNSFASGPRHNERITMLEIKE